MARREKRHRQTYPGPNPEDNQQMLRDIKDSIESHSSEKVGRSSAGSEREMRGEKQERERPESRDREQSKERRSPPSDREQASPGTTPRTQQSRSTPTKQLNSERSRQLREIRRALRPFHRSDPGFPVAKDQVNKTMLDQLINLGHSEVNFFFSLSLLLVLCIT